MIVLVLLAGVILLVAAAYIFYNKALRNYYLFGLIAGLLIASFFLYSDSLNLIISFVIIGATAGYTFKYSKKVLSFILVSSLSITLIFTINHYYLKNVKDIDLIKNSKAKLTENLNTERGITDKERNLFIKNVNDVFDFIENERIIPFSYFINAFFFSVLGLLFLNFIFLKIDINEKKLEGIESFKIKDYFIFVFVAAWLIVLLIDKSRYSLIYSIGINSALILFCFYIIQAIGIIKFIFKKKDLPFFIFPVFLLIILFVSIDYFIVILVILTGIGVIDFYADFRKLDIDVNNKM